MSILAWIVLGIVAGFIGSKLVNKTGEGLIRDLILGIFRRDRRAVGSPRSSARPG